MTVGLFGLSRWDAKYDYLKGEHIADYDEHSLWHVKFSCTECYAKDAKWEWQSQRRWSMFTMGMQKCWIKWEITL